MEVFILQILMLNVVATRDTKKVMENIMKLKYIVYNVIGFNKYSF